MHVQLIVVPYDSGVAQVRMGRGPSRLLDAGVEAHVRSLGHAVTTKELRAPGAAVASEVETAFALNAALASEVRNAVAEGRLPIILAGSCYTAAGTMAGLGHEPAGVVWLDTHADLNTPDTTASGFLDGMAVSILLGDAFRTLAEGIDGHAPLGHDHLLLIGTRDVDPPERERIESEGIAVVTPAGLPEGLDAALLALGSRVGRVYLHVDLDVLDPAEATANTFVAPDGLSVDQLLQTVAAVRDRFEIAAVAFTAYDPDVDPAGRVPQVVFRVLRRLLG